MKARLKHWLNRFPRLRNYLSRAYHGARRHAAYASPAQAQTAAIAEQPAPSLPAPQLPEFSWTPQTLADVIAAQMDTPGWEQELYKSLRQRDIYLLRDHFYRPFVNPKVVGENYWQSLSELAGIEISADRCLSFAEQNFPQYLTEFRDKYPIHKPNDSFDDFYLINGLYMAVDAHVYYSLVRHLKPRRIIEVGAGMSSIVAGEAVTRNAREGAKCDYLVIEPYPTDILRKRLVKGASMREQIVQDVPLSIFESLGDNDVLFIDSTHVVKEGNDVEFLYCEVLPRLKKGVHVHIHDISLPKHYPVCYQDYGWFWNEQILLQAFLINNSKAEVTWPGNYLMCQKPDRMLKLFPEIKDMRSVYELSEPSSFWFKVKD